ncbi:hypothetical protein DPSP01_004358 [Paraphaeosphaeria sporulosa]
MDKLYTAYPLDHKKEHIRLINIDLGPWEAELTSTFSVVSLRDSPDFVALSYVWGDNSLSDHSTVNIEGCPVPVTPNLYAALRRLRWHAHEVGQGNLIVWADALCISQNDRIEKQHQIPLMRRIYSCCRNTAIWLGELSIRDNSASIPLSPHPSESIAVTDRLIQDLQHDQHLDKIEPFDRDETDSLFVDVRQVFERLSYSTWFLRRWVLQEAVLAATVKVYFGPVLQDLDTLSQAMENYAEHIEKACCTTAKPGHYIMRQRIRGFLQEFSSLQDLRDRRSERAHILHLCREFSGRQTSLELDCVYALLGLTNPPATIVPDYTVSIDSLCTEICTDYIGKEHSLDFLHLASSSIGQAQMPTWVVDWTAFVDCKASKRAWNWLADLFHPTAGLSQKPHIRDQYFLEIIACPIDRVEDTVKLPMTGNITDAIRNFLAILLDEVYSDVDYPTGGTWLMAWLRTLSADSCWGANSARRLSKEDCDFYWSSIFTGSGYAPGQKVRLAGGRLVLADAHLNDIIRMLRLVQEDRRIFYTNNGYIGVADDDIEPGDVVFLVPGCSMPMVMRSKDSAFYLQIVSACYLHGWTDGEIAIAPKRYRAVYIE